MTIRADQVVLFVTIAAVLILTGCTPAVQAATELPEPVVNTTRQPTRTSTPTPTAIPTRPPWDITPVVWELTPTAVVDAHGQPFGWTGQIACYDCTPFTQRVIVHHYDPNKGGPNCYDYSDDYQWCMSDFKSGLPWESFYGIAAACPFEWPYGTWVDIEGVGQFICLDRGGSIVCEYDQGFCHVDLLGPGGAEWDGKQLPATLWVPLKPRK